MRFSSLLVAADAAEQATRAVIGALTTAAGRAATYVRGMVGAGPVRRANANAAAAAEVAGRGMRRRRRRFWRRLLSRCLFRR
jgi:hypothetical protein